MLALDFSIYSATVVITTKLVELLAQLKMVALPNKFSTFYIFFLLKYIMARKASRSHKRSHKRRSRTHKRKSRVNHKKGGKRRKTMKKRRSRRRRRR